MPSLDELHLSFLYKMYVYSDNKIYYFLPPKVYLFAYRQTNIFKLINHLSQANQWLNEANEDCPNPNHVCSLCAENHTHNLDWWPLQGHLNTGRHLSRHLESCLAWLSMPILFVFVIWPVRCANIAHKGVRCPFNYTFVVWLSFSPPTPRRPLCQHLSFPLRLP